MKTPAIPINENERLQALIEYEILDTPTEQVYNDITSLASVICGVPIAVISLVDEHRQWFKSLVGANVTETPRDISFCGHAINEGSLMVVENARLDPRFADNPMVIGSLGVQFYAGAPLTTPSGLNIGTLCVIDRQPRQLTTSQSEALSALARQVIHLFELRLRTRKMEANYNEMKHYARIVAEQKEQLFYNAKMASLGRIAAGTAHEINNPLALVMGRLERMLSEAHRNPATPQTFISSIEKTISSAARIGAIVNGLRTFARDGKNDPCAPINIAEVLNEVAELANQRVKKENISLKITCDAAVVAVGRRVHLAQILVNLIANSADAIGATNEAPWIAVDVSEAKGHVQIRVTDSGQGIPVDLREKLMEPFFTTKPVGQGTGLGLSISKGLVEQMGGTLSYDKEHPNTSFVVKLTTAVHTKQAA